MDPVASAMPDPSLPASKAVKKSASLELRRRARDQAQIEPYAEEILRLHVEEGRTPAQIAEVVTVPRRRIEFWLRQKGVYKNASNLRQLERERLAREHETLIRDLILKSRSVNETASKLGLTERVVNIALGKFHVIPDYKVILRANNEVVKHFSDEYILDVLRAAAEFSGGVLTVSDYDRYVELFPESASGRRTPTKQTPIIRFNGWGAALNAAGLPANPRGGPRKKYDYEDAIQAMIECWRSLGHPPTTAVYETWQKSKSFAPSYASINKLVEGGWTGLQIQAWQIIHQIVLDQHDPDAALASDEIEKINSKIGDDLFVDYVYGAAPPTITPGEGPYSASRYNELERAVQSHERIQTAIAKLGELHGFKAHSPRGTIPPLFDVCLNVGSNTYLLVEVKSATESNLELQMRIALGQVLRYHDQMKARDLEVKACIAIERAPDDSWRLLLDRMEVGLLVEETLTEDFKKITSNYRTGS